MCASYGLDPRFKDSERILAADRDLLDRLRSWAAGNDDETLLPTGKNRRNLNPIVVERDGHRGLDLGWWGYLINGEPARFPSINTRSERLRERKGALPARAIVPATRWFEMQKPSRQWFEFAADAGELFAMAAVTQPGATADGARFTCYSIVMRPAPGSLEPVHDRMPLLIPAGFVTDWLTGDAAPHELIEEALAQSDAALQAVTATAIPTRP